MRLDTVVGEYKDAGVEQSEEKDPDCNCSPEPPANAHVDECDEQLRNFLLASPCITTAR